MIGFNPEQFKTKDYRLPSLKMTRPNRGIRRHAYLMAWFFGILSIAVFFLPWQQTAVGNGLVIAYSPAERKQEISAPISGRIARWYVSEGESVKKGDPIVELRDMDPMLLENLRSEREAMERRSIAAVSAVKTAKRNFKRQEELFKQGLSAQRSFEKAELDYMGYLIEEAEAAASLARLDVKLARQLTQRVVAPVDSSILRIVSGQGGQIVKQGELLATVVPKSDSTTVELWLDGNDLPLVTVGRKVRLQFEGWPAIQFGGWPSVAVGTFGGEVSVIDAANSHDGKFRVFVRPEGKEEWPSQDFLRQGVRVNGWVLLEQVSLGYEIWRQLNGFPPSASRRPSSEKTHEIAKKKF